MGPRFGRFNFLLYPSPNRSILVGLDSSPQAYLHKIVVAIAEAAPRAHLIRHCDVSLDQSVLVVLSVRWRLEKKVARNFGNNYKGRAAGSTGGNTLS